MRPVASVTERSQTNYITIQNKMHAVGVFGTFLTSLNAVEKFKGLRKSALISRPSFNLGLLGVDMTGRAASTSRASFRDEMVQFPPDLVRRVRCDARSRLRRWKRPTT